MHKYIFTADRNSGQMAFNEIKEIMPDNKLMEFISPGIGIVESEMPFSYVSETIKSSYCAFVRHICPLDISISYDDIDTLIMDITDYCKNNLPEKGTFSVQTRLYMNEERDIKKNYINETCANILVTAGFSLDIKAPHKIISIIVTDTNVYAGISDTQENISPWPGGEIRFKKYDDFVSRAEFKLLEAIEVFNIDLSLMKTGLDLGAAPGGWTKVLADRNIRVTAVDPANLNESIKSHKNVTHFKGLAQDFFQSAEKYDIIVNDMKMDALTSIDIMIQAKEHLNENGLMVMTLKLKNAHTQKQVNKAFKILLREFRILGFRQLYYNRSEVTVALGR